MIWERTLSLKWCLRNVENENVPLSCVCSKSTKSNNAEIYDFSDKNVNTSQSRLYCLKAPFSLSCDHTKIGVVYQFVHEKSVQILAKTWYRNVDFANFVFASKLPELSHARSHNNDMKTDFCFWRFDFFISLKPHLILLLVTRKLELRLKNGSKKHQIFWNCHWKCCFDTSHMLFENTSLISPGSIFWLMVSGRLTFHYSLSYLHCVWRGFAIFINASYVGLSITKYSDYRLKNKVGIFPNQFYKFC